MSSSAVADIRVAVLGLGYVGSVSAACFASRRFRTVGVDRDAFKVECVRAGRAPFFEPGLEELIQAGAQSGFLSATTSMAEGLAEADVALICVGTPSEKNGNLGLEQLQRVCGEIASTLPRRSKPLIVAVRSTVYPGTCEEVVIPQVAGSGDVAVVCNPEFLREGSAVQDFMNPSLLVVGGSAGAAVRTVADLYAGLPVTPSLVSLRTAEMIKYACNAYHAVKVAFANEIGTVAASMGVDGTEVMATLCRDAVLNVSPAYLKPGFAFGGSCLPKDLRALVYRAGRLDLELPLLQSVLPSNERHLSRAVHAALELPGSRIGVYGLAFKENTDDLRESPVVSLIEQLIGKGRDLRVYDPHIRLERIYGSNQRFVLDAIPHIGRLMVARLEDLLDWADHLIVAQNPPAGIAEVLRQSGLPILDVVKANRAAHSAAGGVRSA